MIVGPSKFGLGLFASRDYIEGYVIGIVEGPVTQNPTDYAIEPKPNYYIEIEGSLRYINHSCNPNVELLGERTVVALRPIKSGEEFYFNYSNFIFDSWSMECGCDASNCRGLIRGPSFCT